MALGFHLLHLWLICMPSHSAATDRQIGAYEASRPIENVTKRASVCRDPDDIRIDGMVRWACGDAIASESSYAAAIGRDNGS